MENMPATAIQSDQIIHYAGHVYRILHANHLFTEQKKAPVTVVLHVAEKVTGKKSILSVPAETVIRVENTTLVNHRAVIERELAKVVDYARRHVHTSPDHAGFPNHRADEAVRDLLEQVIYSGN